MSIELNGVRYTEFNDLYNRPDYLSPDEKAEIELEVIQMGKLIESRGNKYTHKSLRRKIQKRMPKDNKKITQEILKEVTDIEDFIVATDESRFLIDILLQKAVLFSIWRIAELSKLYSSSFIAQTPGVNWGALQSRSSIPDQFTNDTLDLPGEWGFIQNDIPELKNALQDK